MSIEATPTAPSPTTATSPKPNFEARVSEKQERAAHLTCLVLLVVGGCVDIFMAKTTFDLVLRNNELVSWVTAIGITLIALAGAWHAGAAHRAGQRTMMLISLTAPIAAAIALFYLRLQSGVFQADTVLYDGAVSSASVHATKEQVMAVVMLGVFIATTAVAFRDGFAMHVQHTRALREAERRDTTAREALVLAKAEATRMPDEIAKQLLIRDHIEQDLEEALHALDALAEETKAWARLEVARVCGDPVVTSAVINASTDSRDAA